MAYYDKPLTDSENTILDYYNLTLRKDAKEKVKLVCKESITTQISLPLKEMKYVINTITAMKGYGEYLRLPDREIKQNTRDAFSNCVPHLSHRTVLEHFRKRLKWIADNATGDASKTWPTRVELLPL